jgi:hypothetical protein
MIEKKELFQLIEPLIERLKEHQRTGSTRFKDMDEKLTLRTVYKEIYPGVEVSLACDSCVLHCLNMLLSYYEREYPKYLKTIPQPLKEVIPAVEAVPEKAPLPQSKKGKRKK